MPASGSCTCKAVLLPFSSRLQLQRLPLFATAILQAAFVTKPKPPFPRNLSSCSVICRESILGFSSIEEVLEVCCVASHGRQAADLLLWDPHSSARTALAGSGCKTNYQLDDHVCTQLRIAEFLIGSKVNYKLAKEWAARQLQKA